MHTWLYRGNALFTMASTTLGVMCIMASLSDLIHQKPPIVSIDVLDVEGLQREYGHDRAWIRANLTADVRPLFTWNTKQVFAYVTVEFKTNKNHLNQVVIWSRIIQRVEDAYLREPQLAVEYPYTLTDQGYNLLNRQYNVTFAWESIAIVGAMHAGRTVFPGWRMPGEYIKATKAMMGGYHG